MSARVAYAGAVVLAPPASGAGTAATASVAGWIGAPVLSPPQAVASFWGRPGDVHTTDATHSPGRARADLAGTEKRG